MAQAQKQTQPEARVIVNRLRISPIKLGYVAGLIRGMKVDSALTQLAFSSKRIAKDVHAALKSAIANAENNHNMNIDDLVVSEAWVGKSIVLKRMHTRARGRGARIIKPFSNLTIILREKAEESKKPAKKEAKAKSAKAEAKPAKAAAKKTPKAETKE